MVENIARHRFTLQAAKIVAFATLIATALTACGSSARTDAGASEHSYDAVLHMIPNNGHELAFYVIPGQLPAIVLDAGGGADASYWKTLAPELARETGSQIITYDRAGTGRSDEIPGPWSPRDAAADLRAGLTQLGLPHDVVLVSHSLAGEVATYIVNEYPDQVSGAVLVDANLPEFFTDDETAKIVAANEQQIAALRDQPSTKQTRELLAQAADYGPTHLAYHQMSWPQGILAVILVSSSTPFEAPEDAQLWRNAQAQFTAAAPYRRLIVADNRSHEIPIDRPDVVGKAVMDMIGRIH
ncbi:alpha/beta fold hydrolase [Nocardia sp. CA-107356]|uniref:alpha/beta fold hydrolase n=1 Tax=Nocardia sp. CA-107356 TaxID=3239972 RepID=UPI003D8CCD25